MNNLVSANSALSIRKIKSGLNTQIIGNDIILFDAVTSTMEIARAKISQNVPEGLVILAEHQSGGKGRRGRTWHCPEKKGLLVTIVLKPEIDKDRICFLTGITSIALSETIHHLLKIPVAVKWPNDIIVNNKKVAGILIEIYGSCNEAFNFAIGIGVNINLTKDDLPDNTIFPATSLLLEKGFTIDRIRFAQTLLQSLDTWYLHLKEDHYEFIREHWRDLCLAFNQKLQINKENLTYTGKFVDITSKGDLIIELDNKKKRIFSSKYININP